MKFRSLVVLLLIATSSQGQVCFFDSVPGIPDDLMHELELPGTSANPAWTQLLGPGSTGWSGSNPIGFNFEFDGVVYNDYSLSANGVVSFDPNATFPTDYLPQGLPNSSVNAPFVCIWGLNMVGFNDEVVARTIPGGCGYGQHWIFFNSMSVPDDAFCWQYWAIVLEERTNNIYLVNMRQSCQPALTLGVQFNSTTAIQVGNGQFTPPLSGMSSGQEDNYYYAFKPCSPTPYDVQAAELTLDPAYHIARSPFFISGVVKNKGTTVVTSLSLSYPDNSGRNYATVPVEIAPLEESRVVHPVPWFPSPGLGSYPISLRVDSVNGHVDAITSNNSMEGLARILPASSISLDDRVPLIEVFTSSTCDDCVLFNEKLDQLLIHADNAGKVNMVRHPACSPGLGDPYFTNDSEKRHVYYDINELPALRVDGVAVEPDALSQQLMDHWKDVPTMLEMTLTVSPPAAALAGQVTITSLDTINASSLELYVAIYERRTYMNSSTNGEASFTNVLKRMVIDTALASFQSGGSVSFPYDYTFAGNHSIERFWDLAVVAWVQDRNTQRVHGSISSSGSAVTVEELIRVDSKVLVVPNPSSGNASIRFWVEQGSMQTELTVIDVNGRIVQRSNELRSHAGENQLPIPTEGLPAGVYRVSVSADRFNIIAPLSIVR